VPKTPVKPSDELILHPLRAHRTDVRQHAQIILAKVASQNLPARGAVDAVREADRADAQAWSLRMEGFGEPAQPSPTIAQCLNGGYGWLEVKCHRCETRASIPLDAIRRPGNLIFSIT
jgi:hypothetical protein